jgi:hypothetical protein
MLCVADCGILKISEKMMPSVTRSLLVVTDENPVSNRTSYILDANEVPSAFLPGDSGATEFCI